MTKEEKIKIRREYNFRLVSVMGFALSGALVISIFVILPSYELSLNKVKAADAKLSELNNSAAVKNSGDFDAVAASTQIKIGLISTSTNAMPAPDIIQKIIKLLPSGMSLSGFSIRTGADAVEIVALSGNAGTRGELLLFSRALGKESSFSSVDLPVSNFARETDIDFSLSFSVKKP